jgi:HlyD family secretion protein
MTYFSRQRWTKTRFSAAALGALAAAVCIVIALVAHSSYAADTSKPAASPKAALTVTLTQASAGALPIALAANGSVQAWQEAVIGAEVSGLRVQELQVGMGDAVQSGQVLATFVADGVQADVALAHASLMEANANATEAAANAERARAVQGTGALSAQQVNQYLTAELTAKARVESARAALDAQMLRLRHTQLVAPDSGIISARSATVGSVVGAGSEMFRLIRKGRLEWRAEVTSTELGRIKPGLAVVVTAPSGTQTKGRVRMVAPTVDAQTRNGLVYVDLSGGKEVAQNFKPGMFARGEFELGSSNALTVLQTAVLVRDGFSYVMRVGADNRVAQVKVKTGRQVGERIEILSGVQPEDRLVATGGSFLSEGDLVRVVQAAPAPAATK